MSNKLLDGSLIHEAAHAVVIVALGYRFDFVEVGLADHILLSGKQTKRRGRVHWNELDVITPRHEIMTLMAGICAEKRYRPWLSYFALILGGGAEDYEGACLICQKCNRDTSLVEELTKDTARLVKREWTSILSVAEALKEKQRLSFNEVVSVCKGGA